MVHDDGPVGLDGVRVCFDDERVSSDAGIALVATLRRAIWDRGCGAAVGTVASRPPEVIAARRHSRAVTAFSYAARWAQPGLPLPTPDP
jgi:hypothetical protein